MLRTQQLVEVLSEVMFVFLGLLLVWVALAGAVFFDRRSGYWIALGAFLVYWGLRAWLGAGRYVSRWQHRVRGGSLALVGAMMLGVAWAPFGYVPGLLGAAGAILVLRGILNAALLLRARQAG
jgi:hypothetical protein